MCSFLLACSVAESATNGTPAPRYGLRSHKDSSPVVQSSPSDSGSGSSSSSPKVVRYQHKGRGRTKSADPLGFLLREKRKADRNGRGSAVLAAADRVLALETATAGESDGDDEGGSPDGIPGTPRSSRARTPERVSAFNPELLRSGDRNRLLGSSNGGAIGHILKEDHAQHLAERCPPPGLPLWQPLDVFESMDTDIPAPVLPSISLACTPADGPLVAILSSAVSRGGELIASRIWWQNGLNDLQTPLMLQSYSQASSYIGCQRQYSKALCHGRYSSVR
jgi:hypothetical protein